MRPDAQPRTDPRLRLVAPLGRGGMSEVWLAAMRGPGGFEKLVAVKQLRSVGEDRGSLLDEARLAARLNHPNIVQTFEVLTQGGDYRIVMEFLEGQPLNRVLSRALRTVPTEHWIRVLVDALAGLHHAHDATDRTGRPLNLVHRDVSPHNVFVTWEGGVKLLDFGIAAFERADRSDRTEDGVIKGKLTYMAPEQAMGGAIDRRADLFSVGIILWEILASRRMWSKMADHLVYQELVQGNLPRLDVVAPHTPPDLLAICERALAMDPVDRFQTADAMRRALDDWLGAVGRPNPRELGDRLSELFAEERDRVHKLAALDDDAVGPDEPTQMYAQSQTGQSPVSLGPRTQTAPLRIELGAPQDPGFPWGRVLLGVLLGAPAVAALVVGVVLAVAPDLAPDWMVSTDTEPEAAPTVGPGGCPLGERPVMDLTGDLGSDTQLACAFDYRLVGAVRVRPGVTLRIEPGTVVRGDPETHGALVVLPGARIEAEGTAEAPVRFTSAAVAPAPGDWGGVIVLGGAPTNLADAQIGAGADRFGGDEAHDDSGVLRYVHVAYAGGEGGADEAHGLTLGGVGRGTTLDHVLVSASAGDCFAFLGGNVDGAGLVCVDAADDGFDLEAGYTGELRSLVVVDRRGGPGERNAIEVDNDPRGALRRPVTDPRLADATLCGAGDHPERFGYGLLVQRGARGTYEGLWVDGYTAAVDVDGAEPTLGPIAIAKGVLPSHGDARVEARLVGPCTWPPVGGPALTAEDRWDAGWIDWSAL